MQLKQELQQKGWAQFLMKGKSSIFQYLKIRYFYLIPAGLETLESTI